MRAAGRFVVEAHGHITTLYKSKGTPPGDYFGGLTNTFSDGEVEYFDNSPLTLYDMERYGVEMVLLKPSQVGNTNESQADLVDRYPDKFRACCADMKLRIGGNAARIWDLPVPHERMFMSGRPDVWGVHWEKSVPKPGKA